MRFALRYHTEYRYSGPVFDQHNALRVKPATTPLQRGRGFRVTVQPSARVRSHTDYFGTEVLEFNVPGQHDRLAITAEAEVATEPPAEPPRAGWEATRAERYTRTGGEFLLASGDEPVDGALDGLRRAIERGDPRGTLLAVCESIPDRFEYRPGATFVGSTVDDLLEGGAGVCQDFVHLGLILLRGQGIAATLRVRLPVRGAGRRRRRFDRGRHPRLARGPDPGTDGRAAEWVAADPTNRALAGETHVKIGHGRFYGDVAPIKGVYRGSAGEAEHEVRVTMTRLTS